MPAFLTHWLVLIETAKRSQDAGNDLGSLIIDASALRRQAQARLMPPQTNPTGAIWNTGPLPRVNFTFPGTDNPAMAYRGALAPHLPSSPRDHFSIKNSVNRQHQHTALA